MSTIAYLCAWGAIAGCGLGTFLHFQVPDPYRGRAERMCQRLGIGVFPILGTILIGADRRDWSTAMFAMGMIAAIPFVAGHVMAALRRLPGADPG
jgi:hypothetical protein